MLRAVDDIDGPGVYIRNLCRALFSSDRLNEYWLFYQKPSQLASFPQQPNVHSELVPARTKLIWDQVAVPRAVRRLRLDVLFHHKFSIPLLSSCPTVVQQRGIEYWTFPQWYDFVDRLYARLAIPLYCWRASRVLTLSDALARDLQRLASVSRSKMHTVYAAADARFHPVHDGTLLSAVRSRYGLPAESFFLMVAKGYASASGSRTELYPRKNVQGVLAAYTRLRAQGVAVPPLVVAGPGFTQEYQDRLLAGFGSRDGLHFPGYLAHEDMPVVYSMAKAMLFPSYSESFGIPLVEAMACGCPVITSNRTSCPEVVGDAGIVVDPDDIAGLARAMDRIHGDPSVAQELRAGGLARAGSFSWRGTASSLLDVLREASVA